LFNREEILIYLVYFWKNYIDEFLVELYYICFYDCEQKNSVTEILSLFKAVEGPPTQKTQLRHKAYHSHLLRWLSTFRHLEQHSNDTIQTCNNNFLFYLIIENWFG